MNSTTRPLHEIIRELRKQTGLEPPALASRLGRCATLVYAWEADAGHRFRRVLSIADLRELLTVAGADVALRAEAFESLATATVLPAARGSRRAA